MNTFSPVTPPPAYPLLMIWNNASDKVGLGVVQCGHEFGQRLLVELPHCAEHSLLGFRATRH